MHFGEYELFPSLIGLSPLPQVIPRLFNVNGFGPPLCVTTASPCPWVDHTVSRLLLLTVRPIQTRFRYGSVPEVLNLASNSNS